METWRTSTGRVMLVGVALASATAFAREPSDSPANEQQLDLPPVCQSGAWELKGAGFKIGAKTTFKPEWMPTIEEIAACLVSPGMERTCINVQGRFDRVAFARGVVAAFGSERAAQETRALARASRVTSELLKLGVPGSRILQEPPPDENSFRGVALRLIPGCIADTPPPLDKEELAAAVTDAVSRQVDAMAAKDTSPDREEVNAMVAAAVETAVAAELAKAEQARIRQQHIWADAQLQLSLLAGEPNAVFAPILAVGGGWSNDLLYAHIDLGMGVATAAAQRTDFEVSGSFGYVFQRWPWLELGATVGDRIGAPDPLEPWLEQVWFIGAESSQCLFELWSDNETCIQESLVVGGRYRRGQIAEDGSIERISGDTSMMVRLDVAVVARHNFL
jgi:hypothetical protein